MLKPQNAVFLLISRKICIIIGLNKGRDIMDVKEIFLQTISKYRLFDKGETVVAGVSGGADSVCLLHLIRETGYDLGIRPFAAHLDHMFRGEESRADAVFVKDLCDKWGIPLYSDSIDVPGLVKRTGASPEDAARKVRHKFYQRVKEEVGADKIATGHHRDDHEETVFMNILRGTGPGGLKGIEPKRGQYVRPLIEIPKSAIEEYIREKGLSVRTDSTNLTPDYFRNSLRLGLIPLIKSKYCPHFGESLRRLSEITRAEQDFLSHYAQMAWADTVRMGNEGIIIDRASFNDLHTALKNQVLRKAFGEIAGDMKDFEYRHSLLICDFIVNASSGSQIHLPRGVVGEMGYQTFTLQRDKLRRIPDYSYEIKVPGEVYIKEIGVRISAREKPKTGPVDPPNPLIAQLDYDKIKSALTVRKRRPGDRFVPFGSSFKKKIKDFLIDEKVPRRNRDMVPIFESGDTVVWVGGLRIDDRLKITDNTKTVLLIEMEKENDSD